MQSLLRSLSPEQHAELQSMMEALLRDDRLLVDLGQLAANLDMLLPGGLGDRVRFSGDESLSLDGALNQIGRLQSMERLEDALTDIDGPGDLASVDRGQVRDLLGDESVRDLDALDDLARRLEEAGYLTRDGERLELTPRGTRRIGQQVLDDLFAASSATRSAVIASTVPAAAASARRRPSRTSSATRSISTCAAR